MMMAVSSAHIAVGGFYVRFAEVREVMSVARSGDVTFLSRSKTGGRQSVTSRHSLKRAVCDGGGPTSQPLLSPTIKLRRFRIARPASEL